MKFTGSMGMILLAVWLILTGIAQIISLSFTGMHFVMGALAVAAGVLILMGR